MRTLLLLIAIIWGLPSISSAQELNAGFVQGLWYSEEEIFADETVRIYVALRNNTEHDLTATVRFTDNDKRIGTKVISALPGRLVEAWADWEPKVGEHTITASLTDVKIHIVGETAEAADITSTLAEDILIIDYDTDGDSIGNEIDTDDDGDGIDDETEIANGTDPLVPDVLQEEVSDDIESSTDTDTEKETADSEQDKESGTPTQLTSSQGLERFTGEGTVDDVLSGITNTVESTKSTLDEYREARSAARNAGNDDLEEKITLDGAAANRASTSEELATITRSKIEPEKQRVIALIFDGIIEILGGIYTLILFILSTILSHPAIVQLALLLLLIIIFYKVAKRIGRRPQNQ